MKKSMFLWMFLFGMFVTFNAGSQVLPEQISIRVPRGDDQGFVTMKLQKYNVRDSQHCKLYVDEQSYTNSAVAKGANPSNFDEIALTNSEYPVRTYRGSVAEEPNSQVIAVIWPGNRTMSAFVQEGIRYLWDINDLPIQIDMNTGQGNVTVSQSNAYSYSSINPKSRDWDPTFGNPEPPAPGPGSGPVSNGNSPHGWKLIPDQGFKKLQIAFDVEPEWFNDRSKANGDLQKMFAILEFATNAVDLQFARDLGMQFRLTGVVLRKDTDLHAKPTDVRTTWKNNGLGLNPGSSNTKPNSIPVQQIVYTQIGEGNPVAYQSRTPLNGGNFTKVPVRLDENSGLQHEISHNWGGAHFVYPNDIMSGGGSWFGPTTNQKHIHVRDNVAISGDLPIATNQEYGWNVHPYATPDLVYTGIGKPVTVQVLKNDFDSNGDPIRISTFDTQTEKGGQVSLQDGNLVYTPASGFQGRDSFNYTISDGKLFNTSWVQVDVNNKGLVMRYSFENEGRTLFDQSESGFHATSKNFVGATTGGIHQNGWDFPLLNGADNDTDDTRAFVSFGDVTDPFGESHSVSVWFNMKSYSINDGQNCHIISNSSTAIHKLISGYNIFMDGNSKKLIFEVSEQLDTNDPSDLGKVLRITGNQLQANTWYHAVLVIDRETRQLRAYMNGNQVGNTLSLKQDGMIKGKPNGDRYTSGALGIATYKPKKYAPFVGVMDEFRVYGRSLTQEEITSLYQNPGDPIDQQLPPDSPQGLIAIAGDQTVNLQWEANSETDLSYYKVYRKTSTTSFAVIASDITSTTYIDDQVQNGTTYQYVVTAVNNQGLESENSNQVQATPDGPMPPSGLQFQPVEDVYVRQTAPTTNYGDRNYLRVRGGESSIVSYLKFTVSGASSSHNKALLRLYSNDAITTIYLHMANHHNWTEDQMTWGTQPGYGDVVKTIDNVTANSWIEFDVSDLVQGDGTYSFVLSSVVDIAQLDFQSKEATQKPVLELIQSTQVIPDNDSYVRDAAPTTNYGDRNYLRVKGGASPIRSYLRFSVDHLQKAPEKVLLKVYAKDDIANTALHIANHNDWNENTLTWNNQPGYTQEIGSTEQVRTSSWVVFDVTRHIQQNGTYSFALTSTTDISQLDYQSKEDSKGPVLEIVGGQSFRSIFDVDADNELLQVYQDASKKNIKVLWEVKKKEYVTMEVFEIGGQKLMTFQEGVMNPGVYQMNLSLIMAESGLLKQGLYVIKYRSRSGGTVVKKIMVP